MNGTNGKPYANGISKQHINSIDSNGSSLSNGNTVNSNKKPQRSDPTNSNFHNANNTNKSLPNRVITNGHQKPVIICGSLLNNKK